MVALGKAVRSAEISGHHEITNSMRKIRSIGQGIEAQIPGTQIAPQRAILDTLGQV